MPQTAGVRRRDSVRNGDVARPGSSWSLAHSIGVARAVHDGPRQRGPVVSLPARKSPRTWLRSCSGERGFPAGRAASSAAQHVVVLARPLTRRPWRDDLVGVGIEDRGVPLHLARSRSPRRSGKEAGELAEPDPDPADHLAVVVGDLLGPIAVEPLAEQYPRGGVQRDAAHGELEVDRTLNVVGGSP